MICGGDAAAESAVVAKPRWVLAEAALVPE